MLVAWLWWMECVLALYAASFAMMKGHLCWLAVYAGLIAGSIDGLAHLAGWLCWLA
jgi:hypothetical protein